LREIFIANKELASKLRELEQKIEKQDEDIKGIFEAIHELMNPVSKKLKRRIGFHAD